VGTQQIGSKKAGTKWGQRSQGYPFPGRPLGTYYPLEGPWFKGANGFFPFHFFPSTLAWYGDLGTSTQLAPLSGAGINPLGFGQARGNFFFAKGLVKSKARAAARLWIGTLGAPGADSFPNLKVPGSKQRMKMGSNSQDLGRGDQFGGLKGKKNARSHMARPGKTSNYLGVWPKFTGGETRARPTCVFLAGTINEIRGVRPRTNFRIGRPQRAGSGTKCGATTSRRRSPQPRVGPLGKNKVVGVRGDLRKQSVPGRRE